VWGADPTLVWGADPTLVWGADPTPVWGARSNSGTPPVPTASNHR
jgi:hypothetical protein